MYKYLLILFVFILAFNKNYSQPKTGRVEKLDPSLDAILDSHAKVEIIATGLDWCEGPLWIERQKMLLFSDVPQNIIYKWTEQKGKEVYLTPSGYTGTVARGGEKGSNGLALTKNGQLVICQDGDRRMVIMNADMRTPRPVFKTLADKYQGKKFNSPNDMVYNGRGDLFFTDPAYGLEKKMDDPLKEISFQGVFKIKNSGQLVLLIDSITRPNGIAITPDQRTLIIANSDPAKACWYAYDFGTGDKLINARIFYDVTVASKTETGLPDGLKIDSKGNIFATGPGGVWIFNKKGRLLGKIKFDGVISNCSFSADEKTLYMTADMYVLRIRLRK